MNLNNICIVLARPEESRNIGAACRAMANNDISCLRIVGKKEDYDDERVRILAIHAVDLWEQAAFFDTITAAVADCVFSAGTTRRKGKKRKTKYLYPEEFSKNADILTGRSGRVAVVFGNERTGLTDEELAECTGAVTIPSSEKFASLNLSHAVQIMCYHLFRQNQASNRGITSSGCKAIDLSRLEKLTDCIADNLEKIGFFKITGRKDMIEFWKEILSRAALTEGEAKYVEKVFTKAAGLSGKNKN